MIDIKEGISETYKNLSDLKQLDITDWSDEDKEEMEVEVDEIIRLALATKLKLQRETLNEFLDALEKQPEIEANVLEQTVQHLENMLSNIKLLEPKLSKVG